MRALGFHVDLVKLFSQRPLNTRNSRCIDTCMHSLQLDLEEISHRRRPKANDGVLVFGPVQSWRIWRT